jgi:NAD(P) transhydrogenase
VHYGTIPSKTLRETALSLSAFQRRSGNVINLSVPANMQVASLLARLDEVVKAHEEVLDDQLRRNHVERWHGRARFVSPSEMEVESLDGTRRRVHARVIVLATGSRPRTPKDVPIDHENVFDSDSILSMTYLPESLTVLGGGVIASEYASIFSTLGVRVTMIDRADRPVTFLDAELTDHFLQTFATLGGTFLPRRSVQKVAWDGHSSVITTLEGGETVRSEKLLFALGRVANLDGLNIEASGLRPNSRGHLDVDQHCRTAVPHIYAVGDVIGPPSLASSSMEQGRRAVRHAFGIELGDSSAMIPLAVYTIPEMSTVGLSAAEVTERHGGALVGRASFRELARGQIAAIPNGVLKMVADKEGRKLYGVQIVGEGAAELIHLGQIALLSGWEVDSFVDNIFNFPTLAEGYRVAALDIVKQRSRA